MKKFAFISALCGILILVVGIICKEKALSIITSVLATIYIINLSGGSRYALLFGCAYAILFATVSFISKLYASTIFTFFYLFPAILISFIKWGKAKTIYREPIKFKGWLKIILADLIIFAILYLILSNTNDAQPFLDSIVFASSVITGFLMVQNYNEFWITNAFSGIIYVTIWLVELFKTSNGINIVLLNAIAFIASIVGIVKWLKNIKSKNIKERELVNE